MSRGQEAIERGWDRLLEGDVRGAESAMKRARRVAPDTAEVIALEGAIAAARGDADRAVELFTRAVEIDPEFTLPLIHAAELELYSRDDPEAALALIKRALELVDDEQDFADCVLLKAEAEILLDDDDAARATIAELDLSSLDEAPLLVRAGQVHSALGDRALAEAAFRDALSRDDQESDAYHGLGLELEARGDRDGMVAAWLETRRLDLEEPLPEWHLSPEEFEQVAETAFEELPREVIERLENVPILVDDLPSEDLVREGQDPRLLGLFSGVPLPHKSSTGGEAPSIDAIHLFQRNLERDARSVDELRAEIRITVIHETAHFFGLEDDDLDQLGLG